MMARGQRCCVCGKPSPRSNCDGCLELRKLLSDLHGDERQADYTAGGEVYESVAAQARLERHRARTRVVNLARRQSTVGR